jgi:glyoxalase family protein
MDLLGIHHLTAITAAVRENYRFYTRILGLRLVKRSVNQDDVSAYHLFYADASGLPAPISPSSTGPCPRERRGTHSIVRTELRVRGENTLEWWAARLREHGVATGEIHDRDGRATFDFEDPEGQRLALVDERETSSVFVPWERSPVDEERQIRGLGPIVMSVPTLTPTDVILTSLMNMTAARDYTDLALGGSAVHVFEMASGGPHAELHVAVQPDLPVARQGAGGVHHVAFRTPDHEYDAWARRLGELGIPNSGPVDRFYFRSLYFREPNGVLFEIATDGPGFAVDEDPAEPWARRWRCLRSSSPGAEIVANLKPIE